MPIKNFECKVDAPNGFNYSNIYYNELMEKINLFHATVALSSFEFKRSTNPNDPPNTYIYKFVDINTREWKQHIYFASDTDKNPGQTFDHTSIWLEEEFKLQRPIRTLCIELKVMFNINKVEVNW